MPHPGLLSDEPLSAAELAQTDASRLQPLIDALYGHLEQLVFHDRPTAAAGRGVATRIGLFGGLGQGKSTVVRAVLDRLDRRLWQISFFSWAWDRLIGRKVMVFDASHYQAADLEWRFFEAVLARRINRNRDIFWLPGLALLLVWVGAQWWSATGQAGWVVTVAAITAAVTAALPLLKPIKEQFGAVRKKSWGAGLAYTRHDMTAAWMARAVWALPRVVVIDDLDRASVDQQRAVLRAARRYSQLLGFGFVVSMDESALLASPANPELPEELLRKVVQVELRVPDRGAEDCVLLAAGALRNLARLNLPHAALLLQPLVVADLARLLSLWPGTISPRLVKRLVNDMWAQVHSLGALRADMVVASLRLHTLWHAEPALRLHPDALRVALENNRLEHFERLAGNADLDLLPKRQTTLLRLLTRTRALQPERGYGWHHLISNLSCGPGFVHLAAHAGMLDAPPCWAFDGDGLQPARKGEPGRILRYVSELIDGVLLSAGRTSGRFIWDVPAPLANGGFAPPALPGLSHRRMDRQQPDDAPLLPDFWLRQPSEYHAHVWALWLVRLARLTADERGRAYRALAGVWLEQALRNIAGAGAKDRESFRAACEHWIERERMADAEHWATQPTAVRAAWLGGLQHRDLAWLMHLEPRDMVHGLHALRAMGQRDEELAAARWTQPLRCPDPLTEPAQAIQSINWEGVQDEMWPQPLPARPGPAAWKQVLRAHTEYWVLLRNGTEGLPAGVVEAWQQAAGELSVLDRLQLLSVAYGNDASEPADQRLDRLFKFLLSVRPVPAPMGSLAGGLQATPPLASPATGASALSATLEMPVLAVLCDLAYQAHWPLALHDVTVGWLQATTHQARLVADFPAWCAQKQFGDILASEAKVSMTLFLALAQPACDAVFATPQLQVVTAPEPHWLGRLRVIIGKRDDALELEALLNVP